MEVGHDSIHENKRLLPDPDVFNRSTHPKELRTWLIFLVQYIGVSKNRGIPKSPILTKSFHYKS